MPVLPVELHFQIFQYLEPFDLLVLKGVNKFMNNIANDLIYKQISDVLPHFPKEILCSLKDNGIIISGIELTDYLLSYYNEYDYTEFSFHMTKDTYNNYFLSQTVKFDILPNLCDCEDCASFNNLDDCEYLYDISKIIDYTTEHITFSVVISDNPILAVKSCVSIFGRNYFDGNTIHTNISDFKRGYSYYHKDSYEPVWKYLDRGFDMRELPEILIEDELQHLNRMYIESFSGISGMGSLKKKVNRLIDTVDIFLKLYSLDPSMRNDIMGVSCLTELIDFIITESNVSKKIKKRLDKCVQDLEKLN